MSVPVMKTCYTETDFEQISFHDCYIYGIKWSLGNFAMHFDIDYIAAWEAVANGDVVAAYHFWVCPAELMFNDISDAVISLDWAAQAPLCQIDEIQRTDQRMTPNGIVQWHWEIALAEPNGSIDLWATGFQLWPEGQPVLSTVPYLSQRPTG